MKTLALNKRAKYDYDILEKFEAGMMLKGYEVKAIRVGRINLKGAYVAIKDDEAFLVNADIPPYQPKNIPEDYKPDRTRKLLLHKKEIKSLIGKGREKGLTLVPLRVYDKKGRLKLEFGIGRRKKKIDKRELIKKREFIREREKRLKDRGR